MVTDTTPLLEADGALVIKPRDSVYSRFSDSKKRVIITLLSWCGLLPFLVAGSFIPSIPQIAEDLHTTGSVVSFAVSLSIFATSIGGLAGASYSSFYGRRPVYLWGLPLMCFASIGVGLSRSMPELLVWRFIQALGVAPGITIGAGVIGDIYKLEERGAAMGIYFGACLLGPALAPSVGGLAAHYASWRVAQYMLSLSGIILFIFMYFFFPETSHPNSRGVDRTLRNPDGSRKFVFVNPFGSLYLLRSPNVVAVAVVVFLVLLTNYVLLVPLAYTIGARYEIANEAVLGACFLPCGLGNIIGAPIAGRMSDQILIKWKRRRGEWVPEDRLRAALFAAATLAPLSVLFSGILTAWGGGTVSLVLNLVCLFVNGLAVDMVLGPCGAYCIDILHDRSAESMAVNKGLRSLLISLAIGGILPSINVFGVLATNAGSAILAWLGFGMLWITIRYGDRMRAWVDVGYTTTEILD